LQKTSRVLSGVERLTYLMTKKEATAARSNTARMLIVIQRPCRLLCAEEEPPETIDACGGDERTGGTGGRAFASPEPMYNGTPGSCGDDA
jgi:hypothetical protein